MHVIHIMVHGIALVHAFIHIYMYACSTGETRHDEREREGGREVEEKEIERERERDG